MKSLSPATQAEAQKLLDQQDKLRKCFRAIADRRIPAVRIRIHDDLRLSRLLHTGKDFAFIGFEGRSDRPLSERRIKRSPLRDMATLMMSFQTAADAVFYDHVPGVKHRPEIDPALESLAKYWLQWTSATLLNGYFSRIADNSLLAQSDTHVRLLLDAFLLEQALEDIREKLRVEPERVKTPLKMLQRVLAAATS